MNTFILEWLTTIYSTKCATWRQNHLLCEAAEPWTWQTKYTMTSFPTSVSNRWSWEQHCLKLFILVKLSEDYELVILLAWDNTACFHLIISFIFSPEICLLFSIDHDMLSWEKHGLISGDHKVFMVVPLWIPHFIFHLRSHYPWGGSITLSQGTHV